MKKIENDFSGLLKCDNVHFYGNVWLGTQEEAAIQKCNHVSVADLQEHYSAVIIASGAISDKELGLEGEKTLKGILSSRRIVDWYNGSLDCDIRKEDLDLEQIEQLAIIGNGNIACDISRMLLKDVNEFIDSDTPSHVLE